MLSRLVLKINIAIMQMMTFYRFCLPCSYVGCLLLRKAKFLLSLLHHDHLVVQVDRLNHSQYTLEVCLVVNYDLPNSRELYVHQAGQVGHFGRKGVVVNFVKDKEIQILRDRAVLWHPHMRMSGGPCQYNMTR